MPSSRKHHKKQYTSDDSDSSSSSSDSDSISLCERDNKKKHHKKHYSDSDCEKKKKHDSDSECEKKKHHKKHDSDSDCEKKKHHKKKHCDKSDSTIECYSNDKEHCKSDKSSSSSSSDCEEKFNICDVYDYFKNRLVQDEQLMVAGSSAYLNAVNTTGEIIPQNHSASFDYPPQIANNIVMVSTSQSPLFVRESGVYILFFVATVDNACQFTFFVNGLVKPYTCVGTNSGAGQVVARTLIELNKDDHVVVRNYISTGSSVKANLYNGGSDPGNDITFLIMKIAPLNPVKQPTEHECCELMKCLSHDKKKLFNCLTEKLVCDKELMVRGFNVAGSFSNTNTQTVAVDNGVVFDSSNNVSGLLWDPSTDATKIEIVESGVYKVFFLATTPTPGQFTFAVNGVPLAFACQGSNKGAGQITIRTLLELNAGDVVQVWNHVSANGGLVINAGSGGSMNTVSTILTIFKIAPLTKPCIKPVNCKLAKRFECYYEKFRQFLQCKEYLQIAGSPSIFTLCSSVIQTVHINDDFEWSTNDLLRNAVHIQGDSGVTIMQSGVYDIFVDVATDEPLQYTLFVNGNPDPSTTSGRDSGANRCLMRQFVKLNKGDVIEVRNYSSYSLTVHTSSNAGGNYIGQNALFMAFLLHPLAIDASGNHCVPCVPKLEAPKLEAPKADPPKTSKKSSRN